MFDAEPSVGAAIETYGPNRSQRDRFAQLPGGRMSLDDAVQAVLSSQLRAVR
jgi:hypothetical protein